MIKFDLDGHEFIELNKLLKILNFVETGGEANIRIEDGEVKVNNLVEVQKRKKCRVGDIIVFGKNKITIK
jgi:ribosome-associated protein